MMNKITVLLATLWLSSFATASSIGTNGVSTAFSKGSTSFGAVLGSGNSFDENYFVVGAGAGYYIIRGLELGLDAQYWFSGGPSITKVTPKVTYVLPKISNINPYFGAFYRRTFYGDDDINGTRLEDQNSYGYRAGAYINTDNRVYIGGGLVHEKYMDCNQSLDCSSTYPEIIFTVSF
jgi:hypothetical protein